MKADMYTMSMDERQWDLVVLALGYVLARAFDPSKPNDFQPIDLFGRRMLRRRLNEIIMEIQSNVPSAGGESTDP